MGWVELISTRDFAAGEMKVAKMTDATSTTVSRRSTRVFAGEQEVNKAGNGGQVAHEPRCGSSSDEKEKEKEIPKRKSVPCSSSSEISKLPAVDMGRDLRGLFPATVEDIAKHATRCIQAARASQKSMGEGRPVNFGIVLPGAIYRSSFPVTENFQFLGTLALKTVVSLVKKDFPTDFKAFIEASGIRHFIIDVKGTKKVEIPTGIMHSIMEVVLDEEHHPLLIHCNHGKHRTGCAVSVIRHVEGWKVRSIVEEYQGFAEPKVRECDIKYITDYQVSNLEGLFNEKKRREDGTTLRRSKIAKYFLATAAILSIWITTAILWERH